MPPATPIITAAPNAALVAKKISGRQTTVETCGWITADPGTDHQNRGLHLYANIPVLGRRSSDMWR